MHRALGKVGVRKEAIGFSILEANFMGNSACSMNVTPLAFHVLRIGVRMFFSCPRRFARRFARADCPVWDVN